MFHLKPSAEQVLLHRSFSQETSGSSYSLKSRTRPQGNLIFIFPKQSFSLLLLKYYCKYDVNGTNIIQAEM